MNEHGDPVEEHNAVYLRFRRLLGDSSQRGLAGRQRKKRESARGSVPFSGGRDPVGLGDAVDALTAGLGWTSPLARSDLLLAWADIVGHDTAEHSEPIGIDEGLLTVRCDSTAWATQLRLMRADISTTIAQRFPEAEITSVKFEGPNVPSWKRGPRSVPGRGPRDTYG
jgi:predicted nucleic acid-binding Zn ribbon protein